MFQFLKRTDLQVVDDRLLGRVGWRASFEPIEPAQVRSVRESGCFMNWGPSLTVRTDSARFTIRGTRKDYDAIVCWLSKHTEFHVEETIGYQYSRLLWRVPVSRLPAALLGLLVRPEAEQENASKVAPLPGDQPTQPDARTLTRIRSVASLAMVAGGLGLVSAVTFAATSPEPPPGWGAPGMLASVFGGVLGGLGSIMLLSGYGFRRRRGWARGMLLACAWVTIGLLVVSTVLGLQDMLGSLPIELAVLLGILELLGTLLLVWLLALAIKVLRDPKVKQAMRS